MPNPSKAAIAVFTLASAFPHEESYGMTYRHWLIGQALSCFASTDSRYAHQNAKAAIAHADEVIKLLAEEAQNETH